MKLAACSSFLKIGTPLFPRFSYFRVLAQTVLKGLPPGARPASSFALTTVTDKSLLQKRKPERARTYQPKFRLQNMAVGVPEETLQEDFESEEVVLFAADNVMENCCCGPALRPGLEK